MFKKARAVYPQNLLRKLNSFVEFTQTVQLHLGSLIRLTCNNFYRLTVNGEFVAFGPARTAGGYGRVDEISLDKYANKTVDIKIEVASYYCRSLSTVIQDGYLCAEIEQNGTVTHYTGRDFTCYIPKHKITVCERYSFQRHFSEVYDFALNEREEVKADICPNPPKFISRVAHYPSYENIDLTETFAVGKYEVDETLPVRKTAYSGVVDKAWGAFDYDEIPDHSFAFVQSLAQTITAHNLPLPIKTEGGVYARFDFGRIETGFLKVKFTAISRSKIIIAFSEKSTDERFSYTSMNCHNAITISANAGQTVDFASFEPYTARHVMIVVVDGEIEIQGFGLTTYQADISSVKLPDCEQTLKNIYRSSVRTYAHNAVDLYTDCPSRERAGWLCDSYFTAKTEYALFKDTKIEQAFLQNFNLYEFNGDYPEGVVPMCYPADAQHDKKFIPQWTMWLVIEIADHFTTRNLNGDRNEYKDLIYKLLAYYEKFENEDGLLEKLESWNFVEWSRANAWTQDVNYPTNFLYAGVCEAVYALYGDEKYHQKAQNIRKVATAQSYRDGLFYDHAVRVDGKLQLLNDCSEIAQYYAVLFGGFDIDDEKFAPLKDKIYNFFTPDRVEKLNEIEKINAFIGVYLRLDALLKIGAYDLAIKDIVGFFGEMDESTQTLWEYRDGRGSLDHGFASYALVVIEQVLKNRK
ncbi:MAG: hypothetical protein IKC64_02230 [Clostridia bacterium]|nr:hypothetical protein [Clostridia bacterium]